MKPAPTRQALCAKPDCVSASRDRGYCPTHAAQVRRHGTPYRRDELNEMRSGNAVQQDMDQALRDRPPRIRYATLKGVQVAIEIDDPHAEKPYRRDDDRPLPPEHFDGCTCRIGAGVQLLRDPDCAQHYTRENHR